MRKINDLEQEIWFASSANRISFFKKRDIMDIVLAKVLKMSYPKKDVKDKRM